MPIFVRFAMSSVFPQAIGSAPQRPADSAASVDGAPARAGWRAAALGALCERDPLAKAEAVRVLHEAALDAASHGVTHWEASSTLAAPADLRAARRAPNWSNRAACSAAA